MSSGVFRTASVVCLLALSPAACVHPPEPMPYPPVRVVVGRFSWLPPNEHGWVRADVGENQFMAGRRDAAPDETYALQATVDEISAELAAVGFVEHLRRIAATASQETSARYSDAGMDVQPADEISPGCARMIVKSTDNAPTRASGSTDPMVLTAVSFWCPHPRAPELGIMLGYSQRCAPGHEDPDLTQKATQIAGTLEFLDGP